MKTERKIAQLLPILISLVSEKSYLNIRKLSLYKTLLFFKNYSRKRSNMWGTRPRSYFHISEPFCISSRRIWGGWAKEKAGI